MITKTLENDTVAILPRTGKKRFYKARPFILERLAKVPRGQSAILLIDDEQQVADVSFNQSEKGSRSTH